MKKRKAERAGAVQPEEEKAPGRPQCSFSILKADRQTMTGQGEMVLN